MTLTANEILARVEAHILTNPGAAIGANGCTYLNNHTKNRCFVGLFIPDGHPAQQSHHGVTKLFEKHPDLNRTLGPHLDLLSVLQEIHDEPASWQENCLSPQGWQRFNALKAIYAEPA